MVLSVASRTRVGLEFHEEDATAVGREQRVVDLDGLVARLVGPDEVALDRQLWDHVRGNLRPGELFDHALKIDREEDVGAPLELVRGQVPPAVHVFEDLGKRVRLGASIGGHIASYTVRCCEHTSWLCRVRTPGVGPRDELDPICEHADDAQVGRVYSRGGKLQIDYKSSDGKRRQKSTGLNVGDEEKAEEVLKIIEARVAEERAELDARGGRSRQRKRTRALTVEKYFETWISKRQHLKTIKDEETRLRLHAMPIVGSIAIRALRPRDVRDMVDQLRATDLAPRTQLHVYRSLKTMLNRAERDEVIASNPCNLDKHELPKKRDKDLGWRAKAVFTRSELIGLISDPRAPPVRRVFYAIVFLTGARFGEVAALLWSDLIEKEPLPMLHIFKSYDTKSMTVDDTKTETAREVPTRRWDAFSTGGAPSASSRRLAGIRSTTTSSCRGRRHAGRAVVWVVRGHLGAATWRARRSPSIAPRSSSGGARRTTPGRRSSRSPGKMDAATCSSG